MKINSQPPTMLTEMPDLKLSSPGMKSTVAYAKNYTFEQQERINEKFKLVAFVPVNTAFALESHFIQEKDYVDGNMHYIPYEITDEEEKEIYGTKFGFYIFIIDDKYVRKRVEKRLKRKLEWHIYTFNEDDRTPQDDD